MPPRTTSANSLADAVAKQVECGIDVVSDGEMSKTGYATYIQDRLSVSIGDPRPSKRDRRRRGHRYRTFTGELDSSAASHAAQMLMTSNSS